MHRRWFGAVVTAALVVAGAPAGAAGTQEAPPGQILYVRGESFSSVIHAVNPDGTDDEAIDPAGHGGSFMHAPDWSPDGTRIVYETAYGGDFYVLDLSGAEPELVDSLPIEGSDPKWSPGADRFVYFATAPNNPGTGSGSQVFTVPVGGGTPTQVTAGNDTGDVGSVGNQRAYDPDWSSDGRIVFARQWTTVVCCTPTGMNYGEVGYALSTMAADGSDVQDLATSTEDAFAHPEYSPDGKWLAYDHDAGNDGDRDIVVRNVATGVETVLTDGGDPSWSPDGTEIAYSLGLDVLRISIEGGAPFNVTEPTGQCRGNFFCGSPAWQPSGGDNERAVSIDVSGDRAEGKVTVDGFAGCRKNVPVKLQRKTQKGWKTTDSTTTDSKGRYSAPLDKKGKYRARAPELTKAGEVCLAATSKVVKYPG
jgi:hypothetical protein